jgi:hypothetical protein
VWHTEAVASCTQGGAEWTALPEGVTWFAPALCAVTGYSYRISARFGAPHVRLPRGILLWFLRFACGLEVVIAFHEAADDGPWGVNIAASRPDREHVMFHVGDVVEDDARWIDQVAPARARAAVSRDDAGATREASPELQAVANAMVEALRWRNEHPEEAAALEAEADRRKTEIARGVLRERGLLVDCPQCGGDSVVGDDPGDPRCLRCRQAR